MMAVEVAGERYLTGFQCVSSVEGVSCVPGGGSFFFLRERERGVWRGRVVLLRPLDTRPSP